MDPQESLADRFEANRRHLRSVAYRILGSSAEADDAVQEAWVRLSREGRDDLVNLGGWLTTVVARVCLDMLRTRKSRREDVLDDGVAEGTPSGDADAEKSLAIADSIGLALLVVLETLGPAERVAFVLHDLFDLPFDEIAPIVGRSPEAARQLASRARRRVQGASPERDAGDRARKREIVSAFLAAARGEDFGALLAVLDPDVQLRVDAAAIQTSIANRDRGAPNLFPEVTGGEAVARTFFGRARAAQMAVIDGAVGLVFAPGGTPQAVFSFTVVDGRIAGIELTGNPERLAAMDIAIVQG